MSCFCSPFTLCSGFIPRLAIQTRIRISSPPISGSYKVFSSLSCKSNNARPIDYQTQSTPSADTSTVTLEYCILSLGFLDFIWVTYFLLGLHRVRKLSGTRPFLSFHWIDFDLVAPAGKFLMSALLLTRKMRKVLTTCYIVCLRTSAVPDIDKQIN